VISEMRIERERLRDTPLAHDFEAYPIDQADVAFCCSAEGRHPHLVKGFVDPHHPHERQKVVAEGSNGIHPQTSLCESHQLKQHIALRHQGGILFHQGTPGCRGPLMKPVVAVEYGIET